MEDGSSRSSLVIIIDIYLFLNNYYKITFIILIEILKK